jgi:hypothetical protein
MSTWDNLISEGKAQGIDLGIDLGIEKGIEKITIR